MHIPRLAHWFFLTNSKTKSASTAQSLTMCCVTAGVTGKISKWVPEKPAPKALKSFLQVFTGARWTSKEVYTYHL